MRTVLRVLLVLCDQEFDLEVNSSCDSASFYTEGVGQSQPRVCFETLGERVPVTSHNPERVRQVALNHHRNEPFQGSNSIAYLIPGLPKLNPGLELANTFGVIGSCY